MQAKNRASRMQSSTLEIAETMPILSKNVVPKVAS